RIWTSSLNTGPSIDTAGARAGIFSAGACRHDTTSGARRKLSRALGFRIDLLTLNPMTRTDVLRMVKRRALAAGLPYSTCCHTFRATGITAYLENGGTIENAQAIAAHESPRTTKLYDRTGDEITLDEVERISI